MSTSTVLDPSKDPRFIDVITVNGKPFELVGGHFKETDFPDAKKKFGKRTFTPIVSDKIIEKLDSYQKDKIKPRTKDGKRNPDWYESVIQAVVNIKNGDNYLVNKQGNPVGAISDKQFSTFKVMDENSAKKFLYVAEVAGMAGTAQDDVALITELPLTEDEKKFRGSEEVGKWLEDFDADKGNEHTLYKTIKLSGLNEKSILKPNLDKQERIRWLKKMAEEKLLEWATNADAKDPFGKGKGRSKKFKTGRSVFYFMIKFLRHYLEANGWSIPEQKKGSILYQGVVSHGKYKKLKATPEQIDDMKICLSDESNFPKELTSEDGTKWKPTKADWYDGFFYFSLGMQMGYRATEGLTIPVGNHFTVISKKGIARGFEPQEIGVEDTGEVDEEGIPYYLVKLYTRKTKYVDQPTHEGIVYDPFVNKMIKKRFDEVRQSENVTDKATLDKLGIVKKYSTFIVQDGKRKKVEKTNKVHTLIGADGKYISVGSILDEKPKASGLRSTNQKHLRDILRHCYLNIPKPLDKEYFGLMPLHAIRHLFGQYWLAESGWDYGWVARLGHWGTVKELQDSYGFMPDEVFDAKWKTIHQSALSKSIKLGGEKGKTIAKRLTATEVALAKKEKSGLDKALDKAYEDDGKIIAEQKEEIAEEENSPITNDDKDDLVVTTDTIANEPLPESDEK